MNVPTAAGTVCSPRRSTGWFRANTSERRPPALLSAVRSHVALTKPRIVELLLVTTLPSMVLAAHGLPAWSVVVATLAGGALVAGGANAVNCYLDRDIDAVMARTRRRPLARRAVSPRSALAFGLALIVLGTALLGGPVNWLSAALADAAAVFYVFVYTRWLKRRTSANIVIGGAAGCFPVLVGWAAVTGTLGWPAAVLFAVVFLWTPAHFWALALRFRDDYASAGVPMLPVVAAPEFVAGRILRYAYATVAASLALIPVGGGVLYGAAAGALGAVFLVEAHRLRRSVRAGRGEASSLRLFHFSITYLACLFGAVAFMQLL